MKKLFIFPLLFVTLSIKSKDGFTVIKSDANSVTIEYNFSGINTQAVNINGKTYQKLTAQNCVPVLTTGFPQILRSSVSVALPNNADAKIEIISNTFTEIQNMAIAPSKGSLTRNINPNDVPYTFANIYQQDKFYPENITQLNTIYNLRNQKGASLSVFPVQSNSKTNTLKVYSKIVFKVSYISKKGNKLSLNLQNYNSNEEKEILNSRFINLLPIQNNQKVAYTPINEFGSLLVIYHPAFSSNIQPLVDWKNQKGIITEMVSSAITGTNFVSVKSYIQTYYSTHPNLLYVLLVGDHEQINAYDAGNAGSETKWSDCTYGFLSGNDYYPEVMVGRFSASLANDVNTMVNRTIEYEKSPLSGNWYSAMIGIGSNEGYGIGDEGEADWQHIRKIGNKLLATGNYTQFREFYDSTHGGFDAPGDPNPAMVSASVNIGASIFMYCGHGSQNSCATSNYSNSDINNATNYGKYPFSIQVACNNGTFNGGTCFSETFTRAAGSGTLGPKGAIASCGSSILMAWAEPMDAEDEIGDIISNQYTTNKKFTLGGLFYNAQMHMLDNYPTTTGQEVMETWIMFGDPSCVLRTVNPSTITASHANCINANATSFNLTSSFANNTFASISQNNQVIGTALITASNSNIALTQTFNPTQNLIITITEFNKIPYTNTLTTCIATGFNNQINNGIFAIETIVKNELQINYSNVYSNKLNFYVYDLQGKLVISEINQGVNNIQKINVESLIPSVYILSITNEYNQTLKTTKIIKQ